MYISGLNEHEYSRCIGQMRRAANDAPTRYMSDRPHTTRSWLILMLGYNQPRLRLHRCVKVWEQRQMPSWKSSLGGRKTCAQLNIIIYFFPRRGPDRSVAFPPCHISVNPRPAPTSLTSVFMSECGRRFTPHESQELYARPYVSHPPYCCLCDDGHSFRRDGRQ